MKLGPGHLQGNPFEIGHFILQLGEGLHPTKDEYSLIMTRKQSVVLTMCCFSFLDSLRVSLSCFCNLAICKKKTLVILVLLKGKSQGSPTYVLID